MSKSKYKWVEIKPQSKKCPVDPNDVVSICRLDGTFCYRNGVSAKKISWGNISSYKIVRKAPKKPPVSRTLAADTSNNFLSENSSCVPAQTGVPSYSEATPRGEGIINAYDEGLDDATNTGFWCGIFVALVGMAFCASIACAVWL